MLSLFFAKEHIAVICNFEKSGQHRTKTGLCAVLTLYFYLPDALVLPLCSMSVNIIKAAI